MSSPTRPVPRPLSHEEIIAGKRVSRLLRQCLLGLLTMLLGSLPLSLLVATSQLPRPVLPIDQVARWP